MRYEQDMWLVFDKPVKIQSLLGRPLLPATNVVSQRGSTTNRRRSINRAVKEGYNDP